MHAGFLVELGDFPLRVLVALDGVACTSIVHLVCVVGAHTSGVPARTLGTRHTRWTEERIGSRGTSIAGACQWLHAHIPGGYTLPRCAGIASPQATGSTSGGAAGRATVAAAVVVVGHGIIIIVAVVLLG